MTLTLLQNIIQLYLEENHQSWALNPNSIRCASFIVHQWNAEMYPRIYINEFAINYRNANDEWVSEVWTRHTVLQQITAAISNIYDYGYRCSKLSKSQTNPKFKAQHNNDTT